MVLKELSKKCFRIFKSMKFGLFLLGALGVISAIGSLIPQGKEPIFYSNNFSPFISELIIIANLDNIYHSTWSIIFFSSLCLNLFLCSVSRIKPIVKKITTLPNYKSMDKAEYFKLQDEKTIGEIFEKYGFKKHDVASHGEKEIYYSRKNKIGYLGSWLIHLGILLIIIYYAYGQFTYFTTNTYGLPGTTAQIEGTNMEMKINSFHIKYREDGSVGQYITNIDLLSNGKNLLKAEDISVNNPLSYEGYRFYQNSTGWASTVSFQKNNKSIGTKELIYEGMGYEVPNENIGIQFYKFYPDFHSGENGFHSDSDQLNNPKILYALFYRGKRVGMNIVEPGSPIIWNEYKATFETPQRYTYLQINNMKGKLGALLGCILMTIGLTLSFYKKPKELVLVKDETGVIVYKNKDKTAYKNANKIQAISLENYPLQQ